MAGNIVLAIDDSPERYQYLSQRLNQLGIIVVVVQNPIAAEIILSTNSVFCILLDHDMPSVCPETGEVFNDWNGQYFASEILPLNIPVIITSANRVGSSRMLEILTARGITASIFSCLNAQPELEWIRQILELRSLNNA